MNRTRFSEDQIIAILANHPSLKEHESGLKVGVLCRKDVISLAPSYKWKAKFGGLDVSDAQQLKALEGENAKLKRLLANAMLENVVLKDLVSKNF